jgi:hypothetical protein
MTLIPAVSATLSVVVEGVFFSQRRNLVQHLCRTECSDAEKTCLYVNFANRRLEIFNVMCFFKFEVALSSTVGQ